MNYQLKWCGKLCIFPWNSSSMTLNDSNLLSVGNTLERATDCHITAKLIFFTVIPASICHYFISCNRFSEEMLITALRQPTPSLLPSKPSMCAFTPKSAGGTVPYAWSCLVVSLQVSELGFTQIHI